VTTSPGPGAGRIFHVLTTSAWTNERDAPALARDQFERHGFVHCCFREQLVEIATWWFDAADDLVVIAIDVAVLATTATIAEERSPSRWYPHVYGPLDAKAIAGVHPLARDESGVVVLPRELAVPPPAFRLSGRLPGVAGAARVVWQSGVISGDPDWVGAAHAAIAEGRMIELVGGITVPATLATAYETYTLLEGLAEEITGYDGDGFFDDANPAIGGPDR